MKIIYFCNALLNYFFLSKNNSSSNNFSFKIILLFLFCLTLFHCRIMGENTVDVYNITDLILISIKRWEERKRRGRWDGGSEAYYTILFIVHFHLFPLSFLLPLRREHLSPEQMKRFKELSKHVESRDMTKELKKRYMYLLWPHPLTTPSQSHRWTKKRI